MTIMRTIIFDLVGVPAIAQCLGMSEQHVRRLINEGRMPGTVTTIEYCRPCAQRGRHLYFALTDELRPGTEPANDVTSVMFDLVGVHEIATALGKSRSQTRRLLSEGRIAGVTAVLYSEGSEQSHYVYFGRISELRIMDREEVPS